MKRFFQPVQKQGSSKKPTLSTDTKLPSPSSSSSSNADHHDDAGGKKTQNKEPSKFLTWNANSFLLRVKNNWSEFTNLVDTLDPDVIAVQEVRMPAAGAKGAPKSPGELKDDNAASRDEKQIVLRALSSPTFSNYEAWWSLSDSKYAGTALLVKKCCQPKKVSFSLDRAASKHEPDGRVILAEFESFRVLNTYAPNNGWKDEENAFQRRRKWDKRMLDFVLQNSDKPLIWCGDLNVSHEEIDVSHPEFFSTAKLNGYIPPNKEDRGQPGFTLSERKRFGLILKEGKLVDAYRFLHKDKDMERGFSWCGNPVGKYRGKRMRIDYFLISEKLKDRIVACKMHGQGIELKGFCGSDHCPVFLKLSDPSPDANGSQVSANSVPLELSDPSPDANGGQVSANSVPLKLSDPSPDANGSQVSANGVPLEHSDPSPDANRSQVSANSLPLELSDPCPDANGSQVSANSVPLELSDPCPDANGSQFSANSEDTGS